MYKATVYYPIHISTNITQLRFNLLAFKLKTGSHDLSQPSEHFNRSSNLGVYKCATRNFPQKKDFCFSFITWNKKYIYIREKRTVSVFWVFILVQLENVPKPPKSKSFCSLDFQISCAQLYVWTNISKPEKPVTMELWVQRYQIGIFNIHIIFRRKVLNCFITGPPLDPSQSFSAVLTPEPLTPVSNPRLTSRLHSQYPTGLSFFQSHE